MHFLDIDVTSRLVRLHFLLELVDFRALRPMMMPGRAV